MTDPNLLTYRMRKSTRKIHAISDALVNAKLAMALGTDDVWKEGLLVFYEIFRFLEEAMLKLKDQNLGKLLLPGMARTRAFEEDLAYYYGEDWKRSYKVRDSVAQYLKHLNFHLENDPDMLIAYVYHLYMGLLSGGQILRGKRKLKGKFFSVDDKKQGEAVTDFDDKDISKLKGELRNTINVLAETLDEEKKEKIINEGNKVFQLNNMIIRTIGNTDKILLRKGLILIIWLICLVMAYKVLLF